jgi:hypothetical protein
MSRSNPLRLGTALLAGSLLAGCHAHGDTAVSTVDHGVTIAFTRHMTAMSTVQLSFKNGSPGAVCLSPSSYDPASFTVKTDEGMVTTINPLAQANADCGVLAPGAEQSRSVEAGAGFSRLNMQTGAVCYHYAFSQSPAGPTAWKDFGTLCE